MSETPTKQPEYDLARRQLAEEDLDHEEIKSRRRNREHGDLLTETSIARWMLEHPDAESPLYDPQLIREDLEWTKQRLAEFEANNYQYPPRHEQP